jgi:hypothetical protein
MWFLFMLLVFAAGYVLDGLLYLIELLIERRS